jgi:hypothetical protein
MANLSINDFKSKLVGGGARNNLFKVTTSFPRGLTGSLDTELASFMIKAAQLPASIITPITVPFRGRQAQIAGDRVFEAWGVTVINDTNFKLRNSFETWMNGINAHRTNTGTTNPQSYATDLAVEQLDRTGAVLKKYDFRGCWVSNVSAIDVSYDAENTIEEFGVEFQITYWESNTTS